MIQGSPRNKFKITQQYIKHNPSKSNAHVHDEKINTQQINLEYFSPKELNNWIKKSDPKKTPARIMKTTSGVDFPARSRTPLKESSIGTNDTNNNTPTSKIKSAQKCSKNTAYKTQQQIPVISFDEQITPNKNNKNNKFTPNKNAARKNPPPWTQFISKNDLLQQVKYNKRNSPSRSTPLTIPNYTHLIETTNQSGRFNFIHSDTKEIQTQIELEHKMTKSILKYCEENNLIDNTPMVKKFVVCFNDLEKIKALEGNDRGKGQNSVMGNLSAYDHINHILSRHPLLKDMIDEIQNIHPIGFSHNHLGAFQMLSSTLAQNPDNMAPGTYISNMFQYAFETAFVNFIGLESQENKRFEIAITSVTTKRNFINGNLKQPTNGFVELKRDYRITDLNTACVYERKDMLGMSVQYMSEYYKKYQPKMILGDLRLAFKVDEHHGNMFANNNNTNNQKLNSQFKLF